MNVNEDLLSFLENSPTQYQAVASIVARLEEKGFVELKQQDTWHLAQGMNYYVVRNQSSVIAFSLPQDLEHTHLQMIASHTDSPMFKMKPNGASVVENKYVKMNVEEYGGTIMSTWLDRPLGLAGRVLVSCKNGVESKLVNLNHPVALIPNMAIHQKRDMNKGMCFNPQIDLLPVVGYGADGMNGLMDEVAAKVGATREDILGHDLYFYGLVKGNVWANGQYVSSGRLDDLQCAYCSLMAFLSARNNGHINLYACFDNEEVGSLSQQGARSTFLQDVIYRTLKALGKENEYEEILARSYMVSADNAHAVHPNHPELADPTNRVYINGGIVIKYNAKQSYTSDGISAAIFKRICKSANVPVQEFVNRSDVTGGGTLGSISLSQVSVMSVDIGLPQWAMHSSYETAGCQDTESAILGLLRYYETSIQIEDGKAVLSNIL